MFAEYKTLPKRNTVLVIYVFHFYTIKMKVLVNNQNIIIKVYALQYDL